MNDQIRLMMRLEDKVKKNWKKTRKKISGGDKYEYSTISRKELQKSLDQLMGCFLQAMLDETAKLQREEHRAKVKKEKD